MGYYDEYEWIVYIGGIFAFKAAYGIGANDVANAFATSVGSKSLTIRQAVCIGAVFEFLGAFLLGSRVTDTIRKGIADSECFADNPPALMHGMMCVIISVGAWLILASKYEMPVSTTHSCVGGVIGMTIAIRGSECVSWYDDNKGNFPYVGKVAGIVLSWVISPVFSAFFACCIFFFTRHFVLRSEHHFSRAFILFPVFVGIAFTINSMFVIIKGAKSLDAAATFAPDDDDGSNAQIWAIFGWCVGMGAVTALATAVAFVPWLRVQVDEKIKAGKENASEAEDGCEMCHSTSRTQLTMMEDIVCEEDLAAKVTEGSAMSYVTDNAAVNYVKEALYADPHAVIKESKIVSNIHDKAEKFDENTEEVFKYLQVFTAVCDSFAHGANDVANSIGPFAAIVAIRSTGSVTADSEVPLWVLALGGVGIVFGLATYGYKIMAALGVKLATVTPSRGYAIELGAAAVIIMGSVQGIPLSTTHCQVGATVGVALMEGRTDAVNGRLLAKVVFGWVITLVVVGVSAGLLTLVGQKSPCS